MALTLDVQLEERIQREVARGKFGDPLEVVRRALDLLDAEETWSEKDRSDLDQHLMESMAQIQRGERIPAEEVPQRLAALRAARQR